MPRWWPSSPNAWGVTKNAVTLKSGQASWRKVVEVEGASLKRVLRPAAVIAHLFG
jgi:hypothetical protein